jgi:hypothetical protein
MKSYWGEETIRHDDAEGIARNLLQELGVDKGSFGLDGPPTVTVPFGKAKGVIPRVHFSWLKANGSVVSNYASVEVNTANGSVTAVMIWPP